MVTKWLQASIRQSGPGEMPTCRGVLAAFEGLPRARNADFAKGDVIFVTRYGRDPTSRAFPSGGRPPPFRAELHPLGWDTDEHRGWRRGTQLVHLIGPWSRVRPLGVKPTTLPPGNNRRPGNLSSPNPTADLVGSYREDPSYECTASYAHRINQISR